jgi:arylsulfate sulfotransferase
MQKHHDGRYVSSQSERRVAGHAHLRPTFAWKMFVALLLATVFPVALLQAEVQPPVVHPPRLPVSPASATNGNATPGFSLKTSAASLQLVVGGASKDLDVEAVATGGFNGKVTVSVGKLPAGVTASPLSLTLVPGTRQEIRFLAVSDTAKGASIIELSAVSGTMTHRADVSLNVAPSTTTVSLNTLYFDFGNNLVGNKLIQTAVAITNRGKVALTMSPTITGDPSYSIVAKTSCGAELAVGKSCDMVLRYVPTKASYPGTQNATLHLNFGNAAAGVPEDIAISGVSAVLKAGTVTPTNNPQVALYTMTLPFPGRFRVKFGPSTSYGQETWYQSTDTNNSPVSIFVAGMKANTTYHMAAYVQLSNDIQVKDVDHAVKVGSLPAEWQLNLAATQNLTPQPGIEFINPETPTNGLAATDLQGNIIWTYTPPLTVPEAVNVDNLDGAKMLPNGDIILVLSPLSTAPLSGPMNTSAIYEIREINLEGDTVREVSIADVNAELPTAPSSCTECAGLKLLTFHHDVTPLPNGHLLVLASMLVPLSPTSKPPLTNEKAQNVLGDVIIDLDENLQPVWAWNEFNHLDPNRHPYQFPDWTHSNAVLYSADDRNIIVSLRHQNWVLKIDYDDGRGDGHIVWTLGEGGTLKLHGGGTDPTDWAYAQHGPGFFSPNTSGVFSLGLMDNGDDRLYPAGSSCTPQAALPASCLYTTVPVFQIDETASTATLTFHQKLPATLYSFFGGNTDQLANGHVEYDLCAAGLSNAIVNEVTDEKNPQTVWSLKLTGGNLYRAFRIPSLYPGVQWSGN